MQIPCYTSSTDRLKRFNDLFQSRNELSVFHHGPNRHPHMLGKLITAHGPNDDTLAEQSLKYFLSLADPHKNKVGAARHELQPKSAKLLLQIIDPLPIHFQAAPHVFGVIQRGERRPLGRRVDVERLAHALHQSDQLRRADAVTNAQTRESVQS